MNSKRRRRASACPMVVLPEPDTPMITSTVIGAPGCDRWRPQSTCCGRWVGSSDGYLFARAGLHDTSSGGAPGAAAVRPPPPYQRSELPADAERRLYCVERSIEAIDRL